MTFFNKALAASAASLSLIAGAALAQDAMIDASDVAVDGDKATFSKVVASSDGYLVLHAMKDGEMVAPASIGHVWITEGENMDVTVQADYPLAEGESYVAMLHDETNGNQTYEFADDMTDVDTPTMKDGEAVTVEFQG